MKVNGNCVHNKHAYLIMSFSGLLSLTNINIIQKYSIKCNEM